MKKLSLASAALAVLFSLGFFSHAMITGIVVPYPDPTPRQAAYERYHQSISEPLFAAMAVSWFAAIACATCWSVMRQRAWTVR